MSDETEYEYSGSDEDDENSTAAVKIPDLTGLDGESCSLTPMQDDNTLRKHFLKLQEGRSVFESPGPQPVKRQAQPPHGPPAQGAKHTPSPHRSPAVDPGTKRDETYR